MPVQVDPAAYQNAFYAHQDFTLRNRLAQQQQAQQGVENERQNRLLALQEGQAGLQRQRFEADQQQQQRQNSIADRDRISKLLSSEYAPMARNALASGKPQAFMQSLLSQPWAVEKFRADGIFDPDLVDVNAPDFIEGLEAIAGMADPTLQNNTPSNVREWQYYNSLPQDQQQQYLEMKRAQQTFLPTIGNVPTVVRPGVAGGPTQMQPLTDIGSVADNAATVAGAEAGARSRATADVAAQETQRQNDRSFAVYQTAMKGVSDALEASATGPLSGRFPAFTAKQQTAEGAIAAIAPALKQLFRTSGEGTFTDADQRLLLDMVPKRTDHPEARRAKIANINAIVAAKLGNTAPSQQPGGGATGGWSVEVVQ